MGDIYRERERYYRDDFPEDDYRKTTVTRYKVPSKRGGNTDLERTTERVVEVDDAGKSHFSNRDHLDVAPRDRGFPERPRSAFEPGYGRGDERYYEREVERDVWREDGRSRVSGQTHRDRGYDYDRDHDRRSRYDDEIRVERLSEDKFDDAHGHEVERIRKETEYYVPQESPAPVVIRQRAEPQKIIFEEAPAPAPIVLARHRERERDPREDDYYYHRESRTVGPYRGDHRRDDDYAMMRYDRGRDRRRDDEDDNEDYYVHRRRVVRRASSSSSSGHKKELVGGALAAAGITALVNSRRDSDGDLPANRGKKVLAGAALGALGTEALTRARSAYGDRWSDRRGESPDDHSRLKKGLGIAAVALAAAGAAKYYQSNKVEREESRRGRSRGRRRHSHRDGRSLSRASGAYYSSSSRSPSRSKSRKRSLSKAAAAVLGTAATAGIVKKIHDRSKSRRRSSSSRRSRSRSRSKSKVRRLAEIGGVAATAGVASKMWKNHREKKEEEKDRERERAYASDDSRYYGRRGRSRDYESRSRSRSQARSFSRGPASDRELGMVEYGDGALPPAREYEDEAEERRRRRRRRRDRSLSSSDEERKRSRSRLKDMAAAGAAAVGLKEATKDRRDERSRSRSRQPRVERSRSRGPGRRGRPSYDDDYYDRGSRSPPTASGGAYYPPYPGTPGPNPAAPPPPGQAPYAHFPSNPSDPNLHDPYPAPGAPPQPYVPQDYMGYGPAPAPGQPPPGPPPPPSMVPGHPPPPAGGPSMPPTYVSDEYSDALRDRNALRRQAYSPHAIALLRREGTSSVAGDGLLQPEGSVASRGESDGLLKPEDSPKQPPAQKGRGVTFIPLSPKSSMTMRRHHMDQITVEEGDDADTDTSGTVDAPIAMRARRGSDPTAGRRAARKRLGGDEASSSVEELPRRFDEHGVPLDGPAGRDGRSPRLTTRRGDFHRKPAKAGDWDVRGQWALAGSDGVAIERLARRFTDVLDGRRGWGEVLGDLLLPEGSGRRR